jgi:hypothetical protein
MTKTPTRMRKTMAKLAPTAYRAQGVATAGHQKARLIARVEGPLGVDVVAPEHGPALAGAQHPSRAHSPTQAWLDDRAPPVRSLQHRDLDGPAYP